jgi:hypothetical protein
MKIACIGWGSLIWQPKSLLIRREWFSDGPFLPVEFVRQSLDGRLTLVITETAKPIRTLWALMATENLETAKNSLLVREGIPNRNLESSIGSIKSTEETEDNIKLTIKEWANRQGLDAVIWTNLTAKFLGTDRREPNLDEAIAYLKSLDVNARSNAEEYIRKTPKQIDTDFRRKFETEFGWTFVS